MPKRILIIEDDPDIVAIMTYALEEEGYLVISRNTTGSPGEIAQIGPALILMDNQLKEGYGADSCRLLKESPATAHFPVVLVSANSDIEIMAAAVKADGLLKKPFEFEDLVAIVKRLTEPAA